MADHPVHRRIAGLLLALACAAPASGAAPGAATPDVPGLRLADRVEAELLRRRAALEDDPAHWGLVFPVSQERLLAFMGQIQVFGPSHDLVLGTGWGLESHGAGLLALLFAYWRPDGRAPRLGDAFHFQASRTSVPLAALYASNRRQIFLPVPGLAPDAIRGALPDTPQLPRMRFRLPGVAPVEVDAYHLLELLIAHEPDVSATWPNHLEQHLSVALLLDQTRAHYLAGRDTPAEPADHSELHLVEVLLADGRRRGEDPDAVQHRFLAVELQRQVFDPADETLLLGHYAESLGLLLADPRTRWSADECRQVRAWLAGLEARFPVLDAVAPRRLAHLLRGLRLVREHADRLRDGGRG